MRFFIGLILVGLLAISEARADLAFEKPTLDKKTFALQPSEQKSLTAVCFLGTECPLAILYAPRLNQLAEDYAQRGVRLVGVMSNSQDSLAMIQNYTKETELSFPIVLDEDQKVADQYSAKRTPEVFLLDQQLKILYQGRIDDQYDPGVLRSKPARHDLRIAIDESLAGKPVSIAKTEATGCLIGRTATETSGVNSNYTYHKDVVPVLQRNCIECHRKGQIAPFSMSSYRRVSGWADTMLETIEDQRMPPWHADPEIGHFQNARQMSEADKQVLFDWVAAGKPEGNPDDAPPPASYTSGWQLGRKPDLEIEMRDRPFIVPKGGKVEYQYFVADPGFTDDRWIRAAEVIPGNSSVVHHVIVFVRPPDGKAFRGVSLLTAYVPGQRILLPPANYARKVEAGSKLVFQIHYTPNGRESADLTKLGLVFAKDDEVTHEMFSLIAMQHDFEIPPNTKSHPVSAKLRWLPKKGELLGISPHMHYRGKTFDVYNGDQPLLKIPRYDFNWQHSYILEKPIPLSEIKELRFDATFDNSAENPFNPDPTQWVMWGDQTWEEMALAFFEIAIPREQLKFSGPGRRSKSKESETEIAAYVERCFREMDRNNDGVIKLKEAPAAARLRWFRKVDKNRDNRVTREELLALEL